MRITQTHATDERSVSRCVAAASGHKPNLVEEEHRIVCTVESRRTHPRGRFTVLHDHVEDCIIHEESVEEVAPAEPPMPKTLLHKPQDKELVGIG